jgi:peptidyl-prolyl cis-trans isomerase C
MKNIIKPAIVLCAATALVARAADSGDLQQTNAAATPKTTMKDLFPDVVVAKGKGVEVKRSQIDDALISIKSTAAARGQTITPDQMTLLEQQVLDHLVQIQLLMAKATDADKTKGTEAAARNLEQIKTRAGSEDALNRQLKSVGLTLEELRGKMNEEAIAQAVVERELKPAVSEEDAKKYYEDNPAQFEDPEMVRVSHILLSTRDPITGAELSAEQKTAKRKQADELLKRARGGEDFGKLVKEFSEDPGSKDKGGEYTFPRASADPRRAMVPEFEAAAFALKTNEISDVITTQYGYHIIKLLEKLPAKKQAFKGLDTPTVIKKTDGTNVTNVIIREVLTNQSMQKQLPAYLAKLKKDAGLEILDEKLKLKETPDTSTTPAQPPKTQ